MTGEFRKGLTLHVTLKDVVGSFLKTHVLPPGTKFLEITTLRLKYIYKYLGHIHQLFYNIIILLF